MKLPKKKRDECLKHFLTMYKNQWDLNQYARDEYDEDLGYYLGHRNKTKYPLAYSESFNKLMPRVQTLLSRFLGQMYQGGSSNLVSVRPRKKTDVDRAPRVEALLNFQLETLNDIDMQGGSYWINMQWMLNALTFGKGILKLYWKKEDRIAPKRITLPYPKLDQMGNLVGMDTMSVVTEQKQTVYDAPYAEVLHNKMFVPHPHYKQIQQMPAVFCVYKRSLDYVKQKMDDGTFDIKNLKELGWSSSISGGRGKEYTGGGDTGEEIARSLEIEGAHSIDSFASDRITPMVDIIEGYGRYIFPADETPYEVGSGVKIKGRESEAIVHIGNYKTVLNIQKNNYGIRPFFDIGCYMHPELYWDIGIIRLGKGIQELVNDMANLRAQNAMMLVNQMLKIREGSDIDPASLVWKPYGLIPVEEMDDVQPLVTPDVSQSQVFREQEQFFESTIEEITGMYKYSMGQEPNRAEKVGTIHSIQSMAEARTKLLMMTMDHTGFQPMFKYMMMLNLYHLPDKFETRIHTPMGDNFASMFSEDVHMEYDFTAKYTGMEPALGKMHRATQLIQYAQMWQGSPHLQQYQFMKAILEMLDFQDADRYLVSPEEIAKQQASQQQGAIQQAVQQATLQDNLKSNEQNREIEGKMLLEMLKQSN